MDSRLPEKIMISLLAVTLIFGVFALMPMNWYGFGTAILLIVTTTFAFMFDDYFSFFLIACFGFSMGLLVFSYLNAFIYRILYYAFNAFLVVYFIIMIRVARWKVKRGITW